MHTFGYQAGNRQLIYRDAQLSRPQGQTPFENLSPLVALDPGTALWAGDDFDRNATANYTVTKGTGGSLSIASKVGGWVSIPTAASANDYQVLSSAAAIYKFASYYPIIWEASVNVAEAATNKSSWFVGLTDTLTTGFLQNSGAPAASFSGAVFWKATNGMALKAMTSNATTQNSTSTITTLVSGQTYTLSMYLDPDGGVTGKVNWMVSTIAGNPATRTFVASGQLNLTLASLNAMYFAFGNRAGSTSAETMLCDYWEVLSARPLV